MTPLKGTIELDFPGDSKLIMGILVADSLHHHISDYLRSLSLDELRAVAVHCAWCEAPCLALVNAIEAEAGVQLSVATWWVTDVLPAIKAEIARRNKPKPTYRGNSPIATLKQLDLAEVASKYTHLQRTGLSNLKGRCPMHEEMTPSFYIYTDSQRWRCYGACATGGDVVNLLKALRTRLQV